MPEPPHIRHRVQLPDGKHVDIVYRHQRSTAEDGASQEPAREASSAPAAGSSEGADAHGSSGGSVTADAAGATAAPEAPPAPGAATAPEAAEARDGEATAVGDGQAGAPDQARRSAADARQRRERARERARFVGDTHPLHVCFNCAGELVYPLDWSEEGERHWRIMLRCPECEAYREGVFEQTIVERLDDELDRATTELLEDLKRVTQANMTDEIEFFVRALHADVIVPSDFQR